MRILSEDVFKEVVQQCTSEQNLLFCIVMRTAERKRQIKENFRRYRERYDIHIYGEVAYFDRSGSKIHVVCLDDRPTIMYDELIVDSLIVEEHTIEILSQIERQITIIDFGAFEPSAEILEYIGGLSGTA